MDEEQRQLAEHLYGLVSDAQASFSDILFPMQEAYLAAVNYTADGGKVDADIVRSMEDLQRVERRLERIIKRLEPED